MFGDDAVDGGAIQCTIPEPRASYAGMTCAELIRHMRAMREGYATRIEGAILEPMVTAGATTTLWECGQVPLAEATGKEGDEGIPLGERQFGWIEVEGDGGCGLWWS